jgi:hypothetical protein
MQIIGISAAALNAQPLNPVFFVKPVKPEAQAAQSATILLAATMQSDLIGQSSNSFMYVASSTGGITIVEEMMFSSSFSATAGDVQSSSSFVESSSISTSSGTDASYASMSTTSFSENAKSHMTLINVLA